MVQYVVLTLTGSGIQKLLHFFLQFLVVLYLCIAYYNLEFVCDAFIYYFASPLQINELLQYHC